MRGDPNSQCYYQPTASAIPRDAQQPTARSRKIHKNAIMPHFQYHLSKLYFSKLYFSKLYFYRLYFSRAYIAKYYTEIEMHRTMHVATLWNYQRYIRGVWSHSSSFQQRFYAISHNVKITIFCQKRAYKAAIQVPRQHLCAQCKSRIEVPPHPIILTLEAQAQWRLQCTARHSYIRISQVPVHNTIWYCSMLQYG